MSENELAIYENGNTALALPANINLDVAGAENLKPGDVGMPPRLRIVQPNRPGDFAPGIIVNTLTGEQAERIEFVLMSFLPTTRVMWPMRFDAGNAPLCVSNDGETPLADSTQARATCPQAGPCATCPSAQFGADGEPPACKAQRNFLALLLPDLVPVIVTLQSTALSAARQLTAQGKMFGLRKSIVMATKQVEDSRGSWFIPLFGIGRKLTADEVMVAVEFRDELKNLVIQADVVDVEGNGSATPVEAEPGTEAWRDEEKLPF